VIQLYVHCADWDLKNCEITEPVQYIKSRTELWYRCQSPGIQRHAELVYSKPARRATLRACLWSFTVIIIFTS